MGMKKEGGKEGERERERERERENKEYDEIFCSIIMSAMIGFLSTLLPGMLQKNLIFQTLPKAQQRICHKILVENPIIVV